MEDRELRKEMIMGAIDELRGPRFNANEVINFNPLTEYLVGSVIPMEWEPPIKNNKPLTNLDSDDGDGSDYSSRDDSNLDMEKILGNNSPILNPNSQIKSFGISFLTKSNDSIELDICTTWGRYFEDVDSDMGFNLNGIYDKKVGDETLWKRESFGNVVHVTVDDSFSRGKQIPVYDSDDGEVTLFIKCQELEKDRNYISIYMVNNLKVSTKKHKYYPDAQDCLFQPSIRVNLENSDQLIGMDTFVEANEKLDFLYRNKPVLATGHLCSVIWNEIEYYDEFKDLKHLIWPDECSIDNYEDFVKPTIRSEFIPLYPINLPEFKISCDIELRANKLAYFTQEELYDNFMKLYDSYAKWIEDNCAEVNSSSEDFPEILVF